MKLKGANYKRHCNILGICDQGKMMVNLNMSHEKMSDFASFPLLGFALVIKETIFEFESH